MFLVALRDRDNAKGSGFIRIDQYGEAIYTPNMNQLQETAHETSGDVAARIESLSCMAYGITHDFNNMLAAVLSNTQAALALVDNDSALRSYLTRVESNTHSAIKLTRRVQAFTEDGATANKQLHLATLVAQAIEDLEDSIPPGFRIVTVDLDKDCCVTAVPHLLLQSVHELIRNSIDACCNTGGTVHIRTRHGIAFSTLDSDIEIGSLPGETGDILEIEDDGEGITQDTARRMFTPFFTTRIRASGLGLTPVVGLTHSSKVALQVKSEIAKGTIVRLCFAQ
jgi:two-component system cell cycle sensor histidine kinase/response regulator CckA